MLWRDGINDLVALKQADFAITMGYKPIAKKKKKITLTDEKDLIFLSFLSFTDVIKKILKEH